MTRSPRYGGADRDGGGLAPGWTLTEVTAPTPLAGANGVRFAPGGELYVAQAYGSEISAVDVATGAVSVISRTDDPITTPDDMAFAGDGTLYVTELTVGRVSRRTVGGAIEALDADLPAANGITIHQERLFAGEYRDGGRIFELFPGGAERRLVAEGLFWPNGMAVGPDGFLYYPSVLAGEIWRVALDGGAPERVADGLALPSALKVDADGRIWTVQVGGELLTIDPRSGARRVVATLAPALDNLDFGPGGEVFVSNLLDGRISRVDPDGTVRTVVPGGLLGPSAIDVAPDGTVHLAEVYSTATVAPDGRLDRPSNVMVPGFPGVLRGLALAADGTLRVSTTAGTIAAYLPGGEAEVLASGLEGVVSVDVTRAGGVVAAESPNGRVIGVDPDGTVSTLATGLRAPTGVAAAADGSCFVADVDRIVHVRAGSVTTVADGLDGVQGLAVAGDDLYAVEQGAHRLLHMALGDGAVTTVAAGLPVGGAPGVAIKVAKGFPPMAPGPWAPFADVAVGPDGGVYVGADGNGSVLALRRG